MADYDERDLYDDDDDIEAYCVRCRQTVVIEDPQPVWTRRGLPATRGDCPDCGGTVFRMGATAAHQGGQRPQAVEVAGRTRARLALDTAYVACAQADTALAEQIADDLQKAGIATWLHETHPADVQWAGGVHPALKECSRLVVVLSAAALADEGLAAVWGYFKEKNKRIVIAQLADEPPPDAIRRAPRFDFTRDYRSAFRQMVQALAE